MNSLIRPGKKLFVLLLLPGLLIYSFSVLLPILGALRYSLHNWSGGANMEFIGLQNYVSLIKDGVFWHSFMNNIYIIILDLIGQIGLAFVFAVMLISKGVRFKKLHRTMAYFPSILSAVVVGYIWSIIYNYQFGLLNALLRALGLENWANPWLDMPNTIIPVIAVSLIWQSIGYYMVILMAGLTSISPEVLEMAEIDGATGIQKATKIIWPEVRGTVGVCVMLCIAGNMRGFENIFVMTGGGPGNASIVTALYAYKVSFNQNNYGYAATISIGIMILSLLLIALSRKLFSKKEAA